MTSTRRPRGQTREKVWAWVRQRVLSGHSPTVREVQAALGFRAVQTAQQHLSALVAEGRLLKSAGRARGYSLKEQNVGGAAVFIPLLGRVQAGELTTAQESFEGYVPIAGLSRGQAVKPDGLFALKVKGPSMKNLGILDKDVVIVRKQSTARSGEIVVAMVGEEATVKTLELKPGRIELRPANPAFSPIVVKPPDEPLILGKVIEVRRYLEPVA